MNKNKVKSIIEKREKQKAFVRHKVRAGQAKELPKYGYKSVSFSIKNTKDNT